MKNVYINGLGAYLPGEPVPNSRMESFLGLVNGNPSRFRATALRQNKIKTRHYALDEHGTPAHTSAGMAAAAVENAIKKSEADLKDVTYLATAATLGDGLVPGLASHVHANLKLPPIEIANFQSVCASIMMAMKSAYSQIKADQHDCAAVSGSEFASRYFRPGFYEGTALLEGNDHLPYEADFLRFTLSDGAGAAILQSMPNSRHLSLKIDWIDIRSYADRFDTCMMAGVTRTDQGQKHWSHFENPGAAFREGAFVLTQDFHLLKKMIPVWVSHYLDLIDQKKIVLADIDHLCCHYSSHSLREETIALLKKAGAMIDEDKWFTNLYTKGNTGSASILIMLEELCYSGKLKHGQKILCHVPESGRGLNGLMSLTVTNEKEIT